MPKKLITILFLLTISMCANAQAAGQYVTKKPAQKTTQKSSQKSTQKSAQKTTQKSSQRQQTQKGNSSTSKAKGNNGGSSRSNSTAIPLCPDNHHPHMIDLGLPSGTKWACCNVGASKPEDYGGYFAWGETETKSTYDASIYKYCQNGKYVNLGSSIAGTQYDVAHVKWGGDWQMSSQEQFKELFDNCTYEWTKVNGIEGGKFTSKKNGTSLFLPAAGYRSHVSLYNAGTDGYYWSSTLNPSNSGRAYGLSFDSGSAYKFNQDDVRHYGHTVRPVSSNSHSSQRQQTQNGSASSSKGNGTANSLCPDSHHPHMIDLRLPSGTKWACCNVGADKPESYGGYYAWGETETKSTYDRSTYTYYQNGKYVNLGSSIAGTQYDVAHVKWDADWQMPSLDQIKELLDNCTYKWTNVNGKEGGLFTSKKNDASIFLPAAGYRNNSNLNRADSNGYYWSSTSGPNFSYDAYDLRFDSGGVFWFHYYNRYDGQNVRPVSSN